MANDRIQIVTSNGTMNEHKILTLRGPLTIQTIFDFQTTIRAEQSPVVIVDLSGVPYMDSAGLGAIVGAYVSANRSNRKLVLAGLNERVKALISMTHLGRLFPSYDTVADAERATVALN
ncbi:MAG TPA: STAS domain-containing protein [Candidatus Acidoferrum sp.]|nr:STAS domain-containing protein [Candidatus Acidoferrum sp.]